MVKGFTGDRVADALEAEGVDVMVIYGPEYDMWLDGIDPELQAAMARAYNRWGAGDARDVEGVVITSGPVPLNDVARAVDEIQYAYDELGIRCFWARPDQFNHRNLGDRYYDPIYELLQDLDCAFATHEFMGLNAVDRGLRPLRHVHRVAHRRAPARGAVRAAVDDRARRVRALPRLRVRVHGGRLRLAAVVAAPHRRAPRAAGAAEAPDLTMSATDYFRRNCWISTECDDRFVADVIRWMGDDHIVFETDFPHPDSKYPQATEHFLALTRRSISDESKRKILWDNARRPLPLPRRYLPVS